MATAVESTPAFVQKTYDAMAKRLAVVRRRLGRPLTLTETRAYDDAPQGDKGRRKVVVTRTRDGGKSFQVLSRGLPQEWAYDLVYRHSLDIDRSGDRLMFGSTTGNLWSSEDQGDSWQTLSHHLPPVYCVRFG